MKITIFLFVALITTFIMLSCSKSEETKTNEFPEFIELIPDANTKHRGNLTPYAINVNDNIASVSFVESPVGLTIHITDEKSKLCVELFKDVIQKDIPLKIFTTGNSREIAQVNQLPKEALNQRDATSRQGTHRSYDYSIPNPEGIISFTELGVFEHFLSRARCDINWEYSGEGCYARAHKVYEIACEFGFTCYKFFIFEQSGYSMSGYNIHHYCDSYWQWHVGALVFFEGLPYVIDFCGDSEPVNMNEWPYHFIASDLLYVITPGEVYLYNPYSGRVITDTFFDYTNCVLNNYKSNYGCDHLLHGCPPYY